MAYISGISSIVTTVTAWLFVVSPLPAFLFWPGLLLPSLMASFLAEGSKFLFFDTAICRNTVWFPSGADSLPRTSRECSLGTTGHYSIAAGTIFFIGLILVCLRAPEKRKLEPYYGADCDDDGGEGSEDFKTMHHHYGNHKSPGRRDRDRNLDDRDNYEYARRRLPFTPKGTKRQHSGSEIECDMGGHLSYGESIGTLMSGDYPEDEENTRASGHDKYRSEEDEEQDAENPVDRYYPQKPNAEPSPMITTSESRLNTVERVTQNSRIESDDLIQKFVEEMNVSFQVDDEEKQGELTKKVSNESSERQPSMNDIDTCDEAKKSSEPSDEADAFCHTSFCGPSSTRSF